MAGSADGEAVPAERSIEVTTDQKYSCQGCTRNDLTLTRNGRVRSHARNGKRVGPDNPPCPEGSNFPVQSTEFHTHRFEYADDGQHMAGSYCTVDDCGMLEPAADSEPDMSDDPSIHVPPPPNPFRDPLPGGVHDNAGVLIVRPSSSPEVLQKAVEIMERPAGPKSAEDFLDGSDDDDDYAEPAGDGDRSYWPSRYDGECSNCFAHFDAGELIRRSDDGGYEAKQCCGEGATPQPERPRSVARTLPVVRGRYQLPDPETGKKITASRSSRFAEGIANSYALDQWRHRMILAGLTQDPEILEKVTSAVRNKDPLEVVKKEREFLNRMAENAMTAAGGDDRSSKGTKLHKYTEEIDAGQRALIDVPKDYRPDAAAYVHALNNCGFRPVKGLIERSVFCREMNVCGTFDRVLECIRDTQVVDLYGRPVQIHAGEFVIGDVKSGDNIKHPWLEIQIQEALYAHAVNENGVAVQDEPDGPFRWVPLAEFGAGPVREDVGIVMHVPYGQAAAKLYFADLILGWRGAKICRDNRDFWKIKLPHVPVASFELADEPSESGAVSFSQGPDGSTREMIPGGLLSVGSEIDYVQGEDSEEPPGNIMEAVHRAKHAAKEAVSGVKSYESTAGRITYDPEKGVATVRREQPKGIKWWERAFRSATTREGANACWSEAKEAGLPAEEIKRLIGLVRLEDPKPQTPASAPGSSRADEPVAEKAPTPPVPAQDRDERPMAERAASVTTKAEASAIWGEMNAKIRDLPAEKQDAAREYRDKLARIMKERLSTPV